LKLLIVTLLQCYNVTLSIMELILERSIIEDVGLCLEALLIKALKKIEVYVGDYWAIFKEIIW